MCIPQCLVYVFPWDSIPRRDIYIIFYYSPFYYYFHHNIYMHIHVPVCTVYFLPTWGITHHIHYIYLLTFLCQVRVNTSHSVHLFTDLLLCTFFDPGYICIFDLGYICIFIVPVPYVFSALHSQYCFIFARNHRIGLQFFLFTYTHCACLSVWHTSSRHSETRDAVGDHTYAGILHRRSESCLSHLPLSWKGTHPQFLARTHAHYGLVERRCWLETSRCFLHFCHFFIFFYILRLYTF